MPRQPRQFGNSGYLHLIVRGIGKQILFEDREDYLFFLSILRRFSTETSVSVLAYCLMENHVHILVCDEQKNTPLLMKKLGVSYSQYFNRKYERSGHLFQDRYLSEPVEEDAYFLAVFRYILKNPQKAGICPAGAYEWSSYTEYAKPGSFTDTTLLQELIGDRAQLDQFLAEGEDEECLEYTPSRRDDEWAIQTINKLLGMTSGTALQALSKTERNAALRKLKSAGLSLRQIERLTGINRNIVQHVTAGRVNGDGSH